MTNKFYSVTFFILVMVFLSCAQSVPPNAENPVLINSSEAASQEEIKTAEELKTKWLEEVKKLGPIGKSNAYKTKEMLEKLLEKTALSVIEEETERIYRLKPSEYSYGAGGSFELSFIWARIKKGLETGDKEKVTEILAKGCFLDRTNLTPIELYFIMQDNENLFMFFDAYQKAENALNKKYLLMILSRAFYKQRAKYPDDAEFLRESRAWLERNTSYLEYNPHYFGTKNDDKRGNLFNWKKKTKKKYIKNQTPIRKRKSN